MKKPIIQKLSMAVVVGLAAMSTIRCGSSNSDPAFTQIERLGRPAINEGLVLTNAKLNAFNTVAPSADLTAAAAAVTAEVMITLGVVQTFGSEKLFASPPSKPQVVAGFLPDMMRIDTSAASGYNAQTTTQTASDGTTAAMLTGGRKIEDDVIDITLCYLFMNQPDPGATSGTICNDALKDKVTFTTHGKSALSNTFPYLAAGY